MEINNVFLDQANHIYIGMPMNNLTECSDNYSDTSGGLWQFNKRIEPSGNNVDLNVNSGVFNSHSIKYKAVLLGKTANFVNNTQIFL